MTQEELRWRMYGPKLVVVLDPMALSPSQRMIGSAQARPIVSISANIRQIGMQVERMHREIATLKDQLNAGMLTLDEARAKEGL